MWKLRPSSLHFSKQFIVTMTSNIDVVWFSSNNHDVHPYCIWCNNSHSGITSPLCYHQYKLRFSGGGGMEIALCSSKLMDAGMVSALTQSWPINKIFYSEKLRAIWNFILQEEFFVRMWEFFLTPKIHAWYTGFRDNIFKNIRITYISLLVYILYTGTPL